MARISVLHPISLVKPVEGGSVLCGIVQPRGCTSIMRPVAQGYAFVAFGDAQVDLALAEIEKGFSLAQQRGEQEQA